jgi:hypothetical protein
MEKKQISSIVSIIISAAIALAALWGYNIVVVQPMQEQVAEQSSAWQNTADLYGTEAQGGDRAVGDTNVTNLVASGTVTAGTGLAVTSGGQTITAGGQTITAGGLTLTAGQLDIGDWVNASARTAVVVSAGSIITPTGTYQPLTSGGVVTTSTSRAIADGAETGDVLLLRNANAADAITVDGTGGNVECKTDKALGAGDTLMLIWNGADWNNS